MGRKALKKSRKDDPAKQREWVIKISSVLHSQGLKGLTMDKIAALMEVSKATVYDYFISKEEVLSLAVDLKLAEIEGYQPILLDSSRSFTARYYAVMEHLSLNIADISSIYLADLRVLYPHLWGKIELFLEKAVAALSLFYEEGMAQGVFNQIHPAILIHSDRFFFSSLTNPAFLEQADITLKDALEQYLKLKFIGLMKKND